MTEVPVERSALVIGGGLAGMETALALSAQDVPVTLVEKKEELGGHAHKVRAMWHGEPIQTYLTESIRKVQNDPNIKILTNAELICATGFAGNFTSSVKQNGTTQDIRHGVVVIATGGHSIKPQEYGYGQHSEIYRWSDLSKKLKSDSNAFKDAQCGVFIQCVGSREPERPYCSRLCCSFAVRSAIDLKTRNPDMDVFVLYRDMRTFGEREAIYKEAREKGVLFVRFEVDNKPKVTVNGGLEVTVRDPVLGRDLLMRPDFISLQTAIIPADVATLSELYKVELNEDGFFKESPAKMRPLDGETEGVFLAGLALGPKGTEESLMEAWGVAGRAMRILDQKTMLVGGTVAEVSSELCAVCLTCVRTCPFSIPFINKDQGAAYIDPGLCQGCGMCVSECPGKAISFRRISDDQIMAMSESLFQKLSN
jgi:heterodisulfide reductase subunit A